MATLSEFKSASLDLLNVNFSHEGFDYINYKINYVRDYNLNESGSMSDSLMNEILATVETQLQAYSDSGIIANNFESRKTTTKSIDILKLHSSNS